ncbi:RNA-binding domain-containing protein [Mycoplasma procyoni]|uniref:RNA-binding domain-containing protein n=1 Tax=Mycoplasma procyoni TaxID=568784 RepID=UPI00197C36D7|nr:RNA-binding domain-containing protein [Mycoplasma procyoni]MBN3534796.1 putative DNA binding domain-containing protein [Mycoplasma procyoni]
MKQWENDKVEFKWDLPEPQKIKKVIASFLNTKGGEIHLGVRDENGTLDLEKIKENKKQWTEKLTEIITNSFSSDARDLIEINNDNNSFIIFVKEGRNKPYYFYDKEGVSPSSFYIRIGSSTVKANEHEWRQMVLKSNYLDFEKLESREQNLTFNYISQRFQNLSMQFNPYSSNLISKETGKYNNAALLLSDQNPYITKFALFETEDLSSNFRDKRDLTGSLVEQIDKAIQISYFINQRRATINGSVSREELSDYPEKALREAIVNAFCHRDWSVESNIFLKFYLDRLEVFSPGGISGNLTFEDIKNGHIGTRNANIINLLTKIGVTENYASGIKRIIGEYENFPKAPVFSITKNSFLVVIFNRNHVAKKENNWFLNNNDLRYKLIVEDEEKRVVEHKENNGYNVSVRENSIEYLMRNNPEIKITEIQEITGLSRRTISRKIKILREEGKLLAKGSKKNIRWIIKEN